MALHIIFPSNQMIFTALAFKTFDTVSILFIQNKGNPDDSFSICLQNIYVTNLSVRS